MAGIKEEKKIYLVGIYCRLSKDDGTDNESASIATQKSILTDYVKKQGWHIAKTYVDDGYSGTNFQRPSFQNMIKDIESGLINCVITKDLSRLGRNYLDCGLYLEVFFPEHNVRYIAVNDGVDTLNKSAMDITPFRNILNEMYSADVSVKIKSAYRARFQQGKFMGTTAPYGYVKDPADHNHLLIDDKVAHVVREIFDLALAGNGIAKIRKHINKQHILRPAAYAAEQGATGYERYFEENEENRYIWSENSVRGILRSPIYAGNLAGYKRIAANMKSKKRPSKLPEEWEVIPDTHEGIVTQEEFDTVQQLITSRRLPENKGGFENIFAGVIKCADCGYAMRAMSANRRKRPDIIDCVQYSCNNYGRYGNIMCTAHSIEARDLFNAVLTDINRFADMAVNDEKAVRAIEKRLTETDQSKAKALEKEQRKLNKRLAELDRLFSSLYEDKVMERITERNFEMMSGKYQKEQLEIEARLKEVTETLSDSYEKTQGVRDFLSLIRNYQGIKELDATIINALIDKILVSEREKLTDGMVRQEIKIYYKFIGFVGELHITPTKRWTALKPKNCTVCGVEYVPRSGISKYCPACAKKIQREKSNESKRRSRERNRQACIELSAKNDRLIWSAKKKVRHRKKCLRIAIMLIAICGVGTVALTTNDSVAFASGFIQKNISAIVQDVENIGVDAHKKKAISLEEGRSYAEECVKEIWGLKGRLEVDKIEDRQISKDGKIVDESTYYFGAGQIVYVVGLNRTDGELIEIYCLNPHLQQDTCLDEQALIQKMYDLKSDAIYFNGGEQVEEWSLRYESFMDEKTGEMLKDGKIYYIYRTDKKMIELAYDVDHDCVDSIVIFEDYSQYRSEHETSRFLGIENGY